MSLPNSDPAEETCKFIKKAGGDSTWEPYATVTREELETFVKARGGMTQGWTGSLDKLEEYLTLAGNIKIDNIYSSS